MHSTLSTTLLSTPLSPLDPRVRHPTLSAPLLSTPAQALACHLHVLSTFRLDCMNCLPTSSKHIRVRTAKETCKDTYVLLAFPESCRIPGSCYDRIPVAESSWPTLAPHIYKRQGGGPSGCDTQFGNTTTRRGVWQKPLDTDRSGTEPGPNREWTGTESGRTGSEPNTTINMFPKPRGGVGEASMFKKRNREQPVTHSNAQ